MERIEVLKEHLADHVETMKAVESLLPEAIAVADVLDRVIREDGHLFICGNGGSAADSQHWAGEWRGKLHRRSGTSTIRRQWFRECHAGGSSAPK